MKGINSQAINSASRRIATRDLRFDYVLPIVADIDVKQLRNVSINHTLGINSLFSSKQIRTVGMSHTLLAVVSQFNATYDNNIDRHLCAYSDVSYRKSRRTDTKNSVMSWNKAKELRRVDLFEYHQSDKLYNSSNMSYRRMKPVLDELSVNHANTEKVDADTISPFRRLLHVDQLSDNDYRNGIAVNQTVNGPFRRMKWIDHLIISDWFDTITLDTALSCLAGQAKPVALKPFVVPWRSGKKRFGISWPNVPPIVDPPIPEITNDLNFVCRWDGSKDLDFVILCGDKIIKTRKFYYMLHDISIVRVLDGLAIEASSIDIRNDMSSTKIGITANIIGKQSYDRLKETPNCEIQITINDYIWRGVVVDLKQSKQFGAGNYSMTALGVSCYLDDPYSTTSTYSAPYALTLQQVVNRELYNFPGWSSVWDCANWLVAGNGSWSYANKSALSAIQDAVISAGAFIDPDRSQKILRIKSRYPVLPWNFSGAVNDLVIPADPIVSISKEMVKGRNYNSVYVSGTTPEGVMRFVKRAGSAGDVIAESILSHALMTTDDATRAFGSAFIADNLDHYKMSLVLPINNDVPLFTLGELVKVVESETWQGIPQSVAIKVSVAEKGITVRQSVELNRY